MDKKTVIRALRCSCSVGRHDCSGCEYHARPTEEEIEGFCNTHDLDPESMTADFWDYCDTDRICADAAELLEKEVNNEEISG